jgi:DNA-binding IclR family transcriptional regulator
MAPSTAASTWPPRLIAKDSVESKKAAPDTVVTVSGSRAVPIVSRSGSRLPLHATGVGKVLLAHADDDVMAQALAVARRTTPYTVVAPGVLRRQLADVRRRGYASTSEEMTLGTRSVAVPVTDSSGRVFAALGIVAGSSRRDLPRLLPVLTVAARGMARAVEAAHTDVGPAAGR